MRFPIRFLLLSITSISLLQCKSEYAQLRTAAADDACWSRLAPTHISTSWYNTSVDVVGKHISGLLLIKNMEDSSKRVVFTNEAGVTFFDFGFENGNFIVHKIISQLDRKPIVKTLRKDFELILGIPFQKGRYQRFIAGEAVYFGVAQKNETAYFITNKDCAYLQQLEWGTARKRIISVRIPDSGYPSPERIELEHHTFKMQINLTRIPKE